MKSLLVGLGLLAGCGSSSSEYHCCINGAYYQCPDQAAFDKCGKVPPDPSSCTRNSSKDNTC